MKYIDSYSLFESSQKFFGYSTAELLALYRADDSEFDETEGEIKNFAEGKIGELKKIQRRSKIALYRVVYIKNIEDLDKKKLGNHYVTDTGDFHAQMLDYLYRNAWKADKTLKEDDLYLIEIETPTSNIDYHETIRTNMKHPFESEITILNDKLVKVKKVSKF